MSAGITTCLLARGACAQQGPRAPVASSAPVQGDATLAVPTGNARAHICDTARIGRHKLGTGATIIMTVSNEGGWCGKALTQRQGYPFTGGNVVDTLRHRDARLRHLASRSVVEYRATPGYVGSDSFSVTLTPGNALHLADVTVRP